MKKFLSLLLVCCAFAALSAKELKVLMIGNSFSASVHTYLPKMVEAGKTHKLKLANALSAAAPLNATARISTMKKPTPKAHPTPLTLWAKKPPAPNFLI